MTRVLWCALAGVLALPGTVRGQGLARFELGGAINWTSSTGLASADALEFDRNGSSSPIFDAESTLGSAIGFGGRFGFALSDRLSLETSLSYRQPELRVEVTNDVEGASDATLADRISQIAIDGALVFALRSAGNTVRTRPFVLAGGGYLRELHEGQTLAANGQMYFAGAGLSHALLTRNAWPRVLGVRFDGRVILRKNGVVSDESTHVLTSVAGSLFVRF